MSTESGSGLAAWTLRLWKRIIRRFGFDRPEPVHGWTTCLPASSVRAAGAYARKIDTNFGMAIEAGSARLWPAVIDPTELELVLIKRGVSARDVIVQQLGARRGMIPSLNNRTD